MECGTHFLLKLAKSISISWWYFRVGLADTGTLYFINVQITLCVLTAIVWRRGTERRSQHAACSCSYYAVCGQYAVQRYRSTQSTSHCGSDWRCRPCSAACLGMFHQVLSSLTIWIAVYVWLRIYVSANKNLRCWSHSVSGVSVCEWVCESVCLENDVNTISQKLVKGIWPSFGHRCICVHRLMIRFWSENLTVKVTASNYPKNWVNIISS